ncbi:MAG: NAD(P)-dependent glycerol-3-phosphate dehydrogenase [Deltaproteobacteria bacterium]|nr:NAD(P)-dependent glycerol-3-phosphate dehydrogenase [Deltaproteobacteria bacterium]
MAKKDRINIGVIGAGSWGTTLANLLAGKDYHVDLWVREEDVYQEIRDKRINSLFLPDVKLDQRLNPVMTFEEALYEKDVLLLVIPSHVFREVLKNMKEYLNLNTVIVSATKGIENESSKLMSQVAEEVLPDYNMGNFACLAGPSFSKEVARKQPTAITVACRKISDAERLQQIFYTEYFRVYASDDLIGVQLCGALKNVIAIAAGAADSLKFGLNARAALITRGLAEISRLGVAMGANPMTFAGLSGIGDLVLTCTGDLSRNRTVGLKIGQGMRLEDITGGMNMVAEGVKTSVSAFQLAKKMNVDMPIISEVYQVLYRGKDPRLAVRDLMGRELKKELDK